MSRREAVLVMTVMVVLAHAATAHAAGNATVSRASNVLTIAMSGANDVFRMSLAGTVLTLDSSPSTSATDFHPAAGSSCVEAADAKDLTCSAAGALTRIVVDAGAGADDLVLDSNLNAPLEIVFGPGDDSVRATASLRPMTVSGGDGDDIIGTGTGDDSLDGGPGDDNFDGGEGSDTMLGGDGSADLVTYGSHATDVVIDLDGTRDDGAPGENDLIAGVESLFGGPGDDILTGDAGANRLGGGAGSDRIDGGAGFDRFEAGEGNDTLTTRDGLAERVDCGDGIDVATADTVDGPSECETFVAVADLVPDRDSDGVDRPLDCDDVAATTRPGAFDRPGDGIDQDCDGADDVDNDRDRDGFLAGLDCDDGNRAIHPGAVDVPGNRIAEDCDGRPEPFPRFATVALLSTRALPRGTELVGLVLVDLDGRERVRIGCKGDGCKFKTRRARAGKKAESLILDKQIRGQRLRPGARLAVRVTRADGVRKLVTFTMRKGKSPKQTTRCRAPRGGRVAGC